MKQSGVSGGVGLTKALAVERGSVRPVLLALVCFFLGLLASALWVRLSSRNSVPELPVLSDGTKTVLASLDKPVEIRLYSILDPNTSPNLRDFSAHVVRLLAAYQQAVAGKVVLDVQTNGNPNAARADGIQGFNLDKGEGCYLGLVLNRGGKREVLAQLSPAWEPALEADISRAIEHLVAADSSAKLAASTAPENAARVQEIQREIPNLSTVSLEDAARVLREHSLNEFTATVAKMNELVQGAQAELLKAQKEGSAADQEAAKKRLQAIQTEQAQRLTQIGVDSQARLDALKKLKTDGK